MKKRLMKALSIILTVMMLVGAVPMGAMTAFAADVKEAAPEVKETVTEAADKAGEAVKNGAETVKDGAKSLYNSAVTAVANVFADYEYTVLGDGTAQITKYKGSDTEVIIPAELEGYKVTSIESNAFQYCTSLTSVEIPNSVENIYSNAFNGCTNLVSVKLGSGLKNIGWHAFTGTGITEIVIPKSVTNMGDSSDSPFEGAGKLKKVIFETGMTTIPNNAVRETASVEEIVIPSSVTTIGSYAFYRCSGLKTATLPNSVETIGDGAFRECTGLTSVEIPDSVVTIDGSAFQGCTGLTSVAIPNSVTDIYSNAFNGCTNLASVTLGSGLKNIGWHAFTGTGITEIVIPKSVTNMGDSSDSPFEGAGKLKKVIFENGMTTIPNNAVRETASVEEIVIPSSVTTIGSYAFYRCSGLKSVTLPNSVKTIGAGAFEGCTSLTSFEIPDSVTAINSSAFRGCTGLTSITIPDSVITIGDNAFVGCTGLTSVEIPNSVTDIYSNAFNGCTNLVSVKLGSGLKTIGYHAFNGTGITEIVIPKSVTSMGDSSDSPFEGAGKLKKVIFEDGMTTIPNNAVRETASVEEIVIPSSVTTIGSYAFYRCSGLKSVTLPNSVKTIGAGAFEGCTSLTSFEIPDSVTAINSSAFRGCTGLTSITIPDSVITIGDNAFVGCTGLTSVEIPNSVTDIYSNAFNGCTNLASVTLGSGLKTIGYHAFNGTGITEIVIPKSVTSMGDSSDSPFEGAGKLKKVIFENGMTTIPNNAVRETASVEEIVIPSSVTTIGSYAFYRCSGLKSVTLPNSVKTIGAGAFEGCTSLTSFEIPDSVTAINSSAFRGCTGLTSITIPDSVITIGDNAFVGCTGLTSVEIPNSVTDIYSNAFNGCTNLVSVKLGSGLKTIGYHAFNGTGITEIVIPKSVTNMGDSSDSPFEGAGKLKKVIFENGMTTIPNNAVRETASVEEIVIPSSVTTIGSYAFYRCSGLKSVTLPNSVKTIGAGAFEGCTSLTSFEIPDSVTAINSSAFRGCTGLTSITIPDSVITIGDNAFVGCTGLTSVEIPNSVTDIYSNAFNGCTNLVSVKLGSGLKTIGYHAFNGTGITEIVIPKSVTSMGDSSDSPFEGAGKLKKVIFEDGMTTIPNNAVRETASVEEIVIPSSVTTIGSYAFYRCSGLKSVTLPNSVKTIGAGAFEGCTSLTSFEIPDSVTAINSSTFYGCTGLTSVEIPDSVTTINSSAFANCTSLESVRYCGKKVSLGGNIFNGSENVVVYTTEDSPLAVYCVNNNVNFVIVESEQPDNDNSVFDKKNTSFGFASQSVINGVVTLNANYKVKDSVNITNMSLQIKLPKSATIVKNGVRLNGAVTSNYTFDTNSSTLTIPVVDKQARASVTIKMNEYYPITSYAKLSFKQNGSSSSEIIGVVSSSVDMVSISSDNKTSDAEISARGIAPLGSTVNLYVDGEFAKSVQASKTGVYSTYLYVKDLEDSKEYTVEARVETESGTISADTVVVYLEDFISNELDEFKLYYASGSGKTKEIDLLKLDGTRPTFTIVPGRPMTFVVKPKGDKGSYSSINVVSRKDGQAKGIECEWDNEQGRYIGTGYFDENNHHYIPGVLGVEYLEKEQQEVYETINDYTSDEYKQSVSDAGIEDKITTEIVSKTDDEVTYKLHLDDEEKTTIEQTIKREELSAPATDEFAEKNGFVPFTDSSGETYYTKFTSDDKSGSSKKQSKIEVVKKYTKEALSFYFDVSDSDIIDKTRKFILSTGDGVVDGVVDGAVGVLTDIVDWEVTGIRLDQLEKDMKRSKDHPGDFGTDYKLAEMARTLNGVSTLASISFAVAGCVGAITFPWSTAAAIVTWSVGRVSKMYLDLLREKYGYQPFNDCYILLNWLMDPSGFVCEAVVSNRIEGVKTTVYCIPYDGSAAFWDKPGTSKAVKWNANEYDQENPLYTDEAGFYAWDVPEGWWQVKYEKDGYETAYSEWLPVPPPQMQVNVAVKTTQAPKVDTVVAYSDEVEFSFTQYMNIASVTNSTVKFLNNGVAIEGSIVPVDAESSFDNPNVEYARTFKFVATNAGSITDETVMTVNGVKNYTDIAIASEYSSKLRLQGKIDNFIVPEEVTVTYGENGTITVTAAPKEVAAGKKINITLSNEFVISAPTSITLDENGTAKINFTSKLPGNVDIVLNVDGTNVSKTVKVTVSLDDYEENVDHEHKWVESSRTEPTCTKEGSVTYVCSEDSAHTKTEDLPAKGHVYGDYVVTKEPTCIDEGVKTATCSVCGAEMTETIPVIDHNTEWSTAKEPTCTEDGLKVGKCAMCGDEIQEVIPKLGHDEANGVWKIVKEPTATEDGLKVFKCGVCGEILKEEIIPATGEIPDTTPATLKITSGGQEVGDVYYVKLPNVFMQYKQHSTTLGFEFDKDVEVASVKWSYANWSAGNPEANIESPDSPTTVIRPNGRGIGARSTWVTLTVTDTDGNVYTDTVKVRFYKWNWQVH